LISKPSKVAMTVMTTKGTARTVCASTMPLILLTKPRGEYKKYVPIAVMTTGTTIGDKIKNEMGFERTGDKRFNPSAAAVPSAVAMTVVMRAISVLFTKANFQL